MKRIKVFLSVGDPHNQAQTKCVDTLVSYLNERGIDAETLGRTFWSMQKPLRPIRRKMEKMSGAAVLAMERFVSFGGVYKADSKHHRHVGRQSFPTVWTQIEVAMAYQLRLPLLILRDERLVAEGLFDPTIHEWIVVSFDSNQPSQIERSPVCKYIDLWIAQVRRRHHGKL